MRVKPVVYLTKQRAQRLGIDLSQYPNSGPHPNVTGLRLHVYGKDAYLVRQGAYVYKVPVWIWRAAAGQTDANPPAPYAPTYPGG